MRHAILGAGGIGGLLAAALAHGGGDVVLLMRPPASSRYPGRMRVDSVVLGQLDVAVPAAATLEEPVDVLWVTTKATDLSAALALAPPDRVGRATVIPLLNGIDHVALMRGSYPTVLAGSIRVESERVGDGQIRQGSPFLRVEVAAAHPVTDQLAAAGIACRVHGDELTLLWDKLAFLAPVADVVTRRWPSPSPAAPTSTQTRCGPPTTRPRRRCAAPCRRTLTPRANRKSTLWPARSSAALRSAAFPGPTPRRSPISSSGAATQTRDPHRGCPTRH